MVQPAGCLGLVQPQRDFGGELPRAEEERWGGARGGCRGDTGTRPGSQASARGWQTGRGHRPPASHVTSASPCVSLAAVALQALKSHPVATATSPAGTRRAVIQQPARAPRGWSGCSMPQKRMKVPTQPVGSRDAILSPRSSDLCSSTAFTVTFFNPFPREGFAIH